MNAQTERNKMTEYELKVLYETMKPREVDYFKVKELLTDELTTNIFLYTPLYGGHAFFAYKIDQPIPSEVPGGTSVMVENKWPDIAPIGTKLKKINPGGEA